MCTNSLNHIFYLFSLFMTVMEYLKICWKLARKIWSAWPEETVLNRSKESSRVLLIAKYHLLSSISIVDVVSNSLNIDNI